MVSDGMGHGTFAGANHYLNITENRDSEWMRLYREGVAKRIICETHSGDSIVTDSSAASSAWGCGRRIKNGRVNIGDAGEDLTPLYTYARQAGKATGLVTTTTLPHATPAGFVANALSRNSYEDIARQYFDREVDVLLGGGQSFFEPEQRKDGFDLFEAFRKAGYSIAKNRAELEALRGNGRLLGSFAKSHIPFSVDLAHDERLRRLTPTLSEMMQVALKRLDAMPNGFLLQVEGGRVDHGAHSNDPAATIFDQLEFDRCIGLVRKFVEGRDDTLVIITTDHGTGGFMLHGAGPGYSQSKERFLNLGNVTSSYERLLQNLGGAMTVSRLQEALAQQLGLQLTTDQAREVARAIRPEDFGLDTPRKSLNQMLLPYQADHLAVMWTTGNHTGDVAECAAFGPGSEAIPGWVENWEVHGLVRKALGI